jgi:peptide-methionine (S)-S-oxide reductase
MTLTPTVVREYDRQAPTELETATFGLGCFWGPDAEFGAIDGVVRTRVGYAGGTKANPSYEVLGDHTEVVQVEYDPEQVTFAELLDRAFELHDPSHQTQKRQYQNIVFTATERQKDQLEQYLESNGYDADTLATRLESLSEFHVAERYHQKFNLRGKRWITDVFDAAGYDGADVRESPAAAKLNAHVAGHSVSVPFLNHVSERRPAED